MRKAIMTPSTVICQHYRQCLCSERLVFPWINFNADWIGRTATINSTCLLILVEICCEWWFYNRLKSYFFGHFRAIAIRTVWLLHTYIKLISRDFQDVQVKNHVTDNNFVKVCDCIWRGMQKNHRAAQALLSDEKVSRHTTYLLD